jgi:Na+-driven multidrug efflux pump
MPGILMMALLDIDKILLTNLDKTSHAMCCQIFTPFLHILFVWVIAIKLNMGTSGIALSFFLTYSIIFLIQLVVISKVEEAKELNQINFFSKETIKDLKEYMSVAGPSVISMLIEFVTFDIMIMLMGIVGVLSQASMIIFMNISIQVFSIYFGFSIAMATLVGKRIGQNRIKEAKMY